MSDIQEEMKRLYKKAIEKDLERNYEQNLFVGRAIKLEEENKELQNRIDKAKEYIKMYCPMLDNETKPIWNKILKILDEE